MSVGLATAALAAAMSETSEGWEFAGWAAAMSLTEHRAPGSWILEVQALARDRDQYFHDSAGCCRCELAIEVALA